MGSTFALTDPGIRLGDDPSPPAYVMPAPPRPRPVLAARRPVPPDSCDDDARGQRTSTSFYASDFGNRVVDLSSLTTLLLHGLWYSARSSRSSAPTSSATTSPAATTASTRRCPILPAGCRFLLTGTLGAFIRIRQPIPGKRAAVRHRHRRADRRLPRRRAGAADRHEPVDGRRRCRPTFTGCVELGEPLLFQAVGAALSARCPRATRSTCIRWHSPHGSACWPPRSICFRSASSMAATSSYAVLGREHRRSSRSSSPRA